MLGDHSSTADERQMAVDALRKTVRGLRVLKGYVQTPPHELTDEQVRTVAQLVNDGYDHGVATLAALGEEQ